MAEDAPTQKERPVVTGQATLLAATHIKGAPPTTITASVYTGKDGQDGIVTIDLAGARSNRVEVFPSGTFIIGDGFSPTNENGEPKTSDAAQALYNAGVKASANGSLSPGEVRGLGLMAQGVLAQQAPWTNDIPPPDKTPRRSISPSLISGSSLYPSK
ncbi:MAG: hypothetical protein SFW64_08915 [Alphaproteobacteria bacterium]|nr:hypothetical protein [Alphaproteobacteria bacterium]